MNYIKAMKTIEDIKLTEYRQAAVGNYSVGRSMNNTGYADVQTQPDLIVIHVADGTYGGTLSWFASPEAPASAHFTVAMDGRLGQSVYERDTAYHSGKWSYNVRSFGIEHEGQPGLAPWTPSEAMYKTSAKLCAYLCYKYGIPADRHHIIGHSEVDPNRAARRNCPGRTWDWDKYIAMVKQEIGDITVRGHEKDLYNKTVKLRGLITGTGTLVAGTDKVYVQDYSLNPKKDFIPTLTTFRKVRVFHPATNSLMGDSTYDPETSIVYVDMLK